MSAALCAARRHQAGLWDRPVWPRCGRVVYLIMEQHVQPLPVSLDLRGDVLVLQDHALSSTLAPLCNEQSED